MGQIKAGKFKPLAVTTAQRSAELPNVPTLSEAGVSGFEMSTWYGVFVTAGTPPDVVAKLQTELARIIKLPDVQAKLKGLGGEPGNMSPDEFSKMNKQDATMLERKLVAEQETLRKDSIEKVLS